MRLRLLLPIALVTAAAGCATPAQTGSPPAGAASGPVQMRELLGTPLPANSGVTDRRRMIVTDAGSWSALWAQIWARQGARPPVPEVDFDTEMVVFVSAGTKSTGGHSIRIDSIDFDRGKLTISVTETRPGPGCAVTQAMTAPVHAVRIKRISAEPVFEERAVMSRC